jgi:peptidoglycan LD-endopeptidase LytH
VQQLDQSGCVGHYYAHLQSFAPGLTAGQLVKEGDLIGFVGTTGNSPPDVPHLHLATYWMHTPGVFTWTTPLNPHRLFVPAPSEDDEKPARLRPMPPALAGAGLFALAR